VSDLRDQIDTLSTAEKLDLLDALWKSLEGEEVPLTDAQREELDQRIARYERNPSDVVPWEHVKADLINRT
jgi:putative addiction module component (TIGR02574 family)